MPYHPSSHSHVPPGSRLSNLSIYMYYRRPIFSTIIQKVGKVEVACIKVHATMSTSTKAWASRESPSRPPKRTIPEKVIESWRHQSLEGESAPPNSHRSVTNTLCLKSIYWSSLCAQKVGTRQQSKLKAQLIRNVTAKAFPDLQTHADEKCTLKQQQSTGHTNRN